MTITTGLPQFKIKPATKKDVPVILSFIKKLADYERLSDEVVADRGAFAAHPVRPAAHRGSGDRLLR